MTAEPRHVELDDRATGNSPAAPGEASRGEGRAVTVLTVHLDDGTLLAPGLMLTQLPGRTDCQLRTAKASAEPPANCSRQRTRSENAHHGSREVCFAM